MRYTVTKSEVYILGNLWMGGLGAITKTLDAHDLENAKNDNGIIDRESLENWLCLHCGDFSGIEDFSASVEPDYQKDTLEIPWGSEDNEIIFYDCMYPSDYE